MPRKLGKKKKKVISTPKIFFWWVFKIVKKKIFIFLSFPTLSRRPSSAEGKGREKLPGGLSAEMKI
jgi:hypothetical protein